MRIGELCKRTGHSQDTIRFYEKAGLLPIERHGRGFKNYTDWHVIRLLQIKYAKAAGFTLNEIRRDLENWVSNTLSDDEKRAILTAQMEKMDQAMNELTVVKQYLFEKMALVEQENRYHSPATVFMKEVTSLT